MVAHQTNRVSNEFWDSMERPGELVKQHPLPSMLLMFGLGIGVGVVVSQTLCSSLLEMAEEPTMSEKMKRQAYEALSHVLTPSMLKQFQSYTS